ncbi:purine-cytosine permease family protein [Actinomycetospora sp. CA-101289]|uniref:purine-cytosine permease family protein n=1 Tax=Actinomycetospora sp. CA-101289 TaxID=3239893 RepID=UPI003D98CFFA
MSTESATPGVATPADAATRESLEDYTLRFAPRSYRRWTPFVVGGSALGGMAYMADFSIGAGIGLQHGTGNALWAIGVAAVVIFVSGFPLAYYGARYNLDLDLVTRGSGFGYFGSVITAVIFASFTFIFFALEGSIMAQGLRYALSIPLWIGYLISTLIILPLVVYGMKALTKLQTWTNPLWVLLIVAPLVFLVVADPSSVGRFLDHPGTDGAGVNPASIMLGAGVSLALMAQIGEQIDYLRFMPPKTAENRRQWWTAVVLGGPGWVVFGAIKQIIGVFLAVLILADVGAAAAVEPIEQFDRALGAIFPAWLVVPLALLLVVLSQVKINVTNAYSGSLAWTNAFTRVTGTYPGRITFLFVNLGIALVLMEADMFSFLNGLLGFYSNCAIAWVVTVATDIGINKYVLGLSPKRPEFRRGMLHAWNPVGVGSFLAASLLSIAAYFGLLGEFLSSYSTIVAIVVALVLTPLIAVATRGRYYLRRTDDGIDEPYVDADGNPSATLYHDQVSGQDFERPDMLASAKGGYISSLSLSTDKSGEHVLPPQH